MFKRAVLVLLLVGGCAASDRPATGPSEVVGSGTFVCPDGPTIQVDYRADDTASVRVGSREPLRLPRAISASGARYSDGVNESWEAKGALRVTLADGTKLEGCPRQKR